MKNINFEQKLNTLKDLLKVQEESCEYDEYSLGLYNGLELACAVMEDREPEFRTYKKVY